MNYPHFDGQLGSLYTPQATTFRLWAPTASAVKVALDSGKYPLSLGDSGQWEVTLDQDLHLAEYLYELEFPDGSRTTLVDPYARSVTANGGRGVVVGLEKLLEPASRLAARDQSAPVIIYEAHVRDLTISADNGIEHKGKFLGLAQSGTRTKQGNLSGLDYLDSLGVTHVQLLPIFDFGSVDEQGDLSFGAQYNWGYDPVNYNAPEGSYARVPGDPSGRIVELKELVDALHSRGLRVIMDVVYNHVYQAGVHPFELSVPGYYFRKSAAGKFFNATGCGNETASERSMVRKYIVDSVVYWATTFGLDGFRFDLMGIHDVDTMNAVREALDAIDPSIVLIGEGWDMGNHPRGVRGAHQGNAALMPGIGMFDDAFRDAVKGDNFIKSHPGFVSGAENSAHQLFDAMNSPHPRQAVVYNEAHDNWTMFDKLQGTRGLECASQAELAKRHTLATLIQYLTRGTVFVHAGQEFLRTKQGEENSYKSPDTINAFDYDRAQNFPVEMAFFRGLNQFRKTYAWTHSASYVPELIHAQGQRLSYRVSNAFGPGRHALVLLNGERQHWAHGVEPGIYKVHINDVTVAAHPDPITLDSEFVVAPLQATVLEYLG